MPQPPRREAGRHRAPPRWSARVIAWTQGLLAQAFPLRCAACDATLPPLSTGSRRVTEAPHSPLCVACGPTHPATALPQVAGLAGLQVGAAYDGGLAVAIRRFKYSRRSDLAGPLAQLLPAPCTRQTQAVIVPVPSHPARLAQRGYNPASLLAAELAKRTGCRLRHHLERTRPGAAQAGLKGPARRAPLLRDFRPRRPVQVPFAVLVDDVVSTGTTLEACARALRRAGAGRVYAVALACPPRVKF